MRPGNVGVNPDDIEANLDDIGMSLMDYSDRVGNDDASVEVKRLPMIQKEANFSPKVFKKKGNFKIAEEAFTS